MRNKKKTYTPEPQVPSEVRERLVAVMEVLSGQTTVSEGARRLGMSRNHFQTLLHRAQEGMIAQLTPGLPGRPAKPQREAELEQQVEHLQSKVHHLQQRAEMTEKLMGLASGLLHGTIRQTHRAKRKTSAAKETNDDPEDPLLLRDFTRKLDKMRLPRAVVARMFGISMTTLRRWSVETPKPVASRRKPACEEAIAGAIEDLRALRGLIGVEALRHAHPELSRRHAMNIKRETLTTMERERRQACARVIVTMPGVVRGFDAMDLGHDKKVRYVLAACDAAVPFRTTLRASPRYDADSVARVLEDDFAVHGAPLVVRMDRAAIHSAPAVRAVLDAHGVIVLHGPAHYPCFYGQLERQNREHAAWLHGVFEYVDVPLEALLVQMKEAFNNRWPRRALGWQTASQAWHSRPTLLLDRRLWRAGIVDHALRLQSTTSRATMTPQLATRLSIEHELTKFDFLRIEQGGHC